MPDNPTQQVQITELLTLIGSKELQIHFLQKQVGELARRVDELDKARAMGVNPVTPLPEPPSV